MSNPYQHPANEKITTFMQTVALPSDWEKPDVDFSNMDGNAMVIIGTVARAIRKSKHPEAEAVADRYTQACMQSDYDTHLAMLSAIINPCF